MAPSRSHRRTGLRSAASFEEYLSKSNSFSFASEFHRYEQLAAGQRLACLAEAHRVGGKQRSVAATPLGRDSPSLTFMSEGWLAALDDFRNWLVREAA